jgi:hypothetical protein
VLIKQVDNIHPQSFERTLDGLLDSIGAAIQFAPLAVRRVGLPAELGGDYHLITHRRESLPNQFFIGERAVNLSRVEECDTPIERRSNEGDALLLLDGGAVTEAQAHAAKTERRYLKIAKFTLLHANLLTAAGATSRCYSLCRSQVLTKLSCLFESV